MLLWAKKAGMKVRSSTLSFYSRAIRSRFILELIAKSHEKRKQPIFPYIGEVESLVSDELPGISFQENCVVSAERNAVYDSMGNLVPCSALIRGQHKKRINAPTQIGFEQNRAKLLLDNAVFGGVLFATHYGHLLTESTARLWPILTFPKSHEINNAKLLFRIAGTKRLTAQEISENARILFTALGVMDRIEIVAEPIRVNRLIIPHAANMNSRMAHRVFGDLLKRAGQEILRTSGDSNCEKWKDDLIYLSRSRLSDELRKIGNEEELESLLRERGYEIVHPQQLSFADQIKLFSDAAKIVGAMGSAFHTMLLSQNAEMCVKYLIEDMPIRTYSVIDAISGSNSSYIRCLYKNPLSIKKNVDWVVDLERAMAGIG